MIIQITTTSSKNVQIKVIDAIGQVPLQQQLYLETGTTNNILLDLPNLAQGVYTLQLINQNGNVKVKQLKPEAISKIWEGLFFIKNLLFYCKII